jgi:hypothetical protein
VTYKQSNANEDDASNADVVQKADDDDDPPSDETAVSAITGMHVCDARPYILILLS